MPRLIELRRDGSERVPYNFSELPVFAQHGHLAGFYNMKVACHWHDDWEFVCVTQGTLGYFVNGETFELREGQAAFINSRCMHYLYPIGGEDAHYFCLLLHPSLFDRNELIREKYIEPLIQNRSMMYRVMDRKGAMQILNAIKMIHEAQIEKDAAMELTLMHCGFQIIDRLYRDMAALPDAASANDPRLEALHGMIGYVQNHFAAEISLSDIAAAGRVSKSSCCSIFRQYLQQTPVGYLTGYRLEKAADLLRSTNLSITEIAMHAGFASQSYFTETFRKHSGVTPSEFRRQFNG